MAPKSTTTVEGGVQPKEKSKSEYKMEIIWHNVFLIAALHLIAFFSLYMGLTSWYRKTWFFLVAWGFLGGLGITAGAHRLWCHRSYKAKLPLRIFLAICHCIAAETDIYDWSRDHRVHHKYTETDADPHNILRGAFFAHVGWLMCKKHPEVTAGGKTVYLGDLLADPVVRIQKRFHIPLCLFFSFFVPTLIVHWYCHETLWDSIIANIGRYVYILNVTWFVNSAAHMFGDRPFDKSIAPKENSAVALLAIGEGWHNYHHVFPWDYSASELGYYLNPTKMVIDLMACIGQAYDLKRASPREIQNKKLKMGDGTRIDKH